MDHPIGEVGVVAVGTYVEMAMLESHLQLSDESFGGPDIVKYDHGKFGIGSTCSYYPRWCVEYQPKRRALAPGQGGQY